jgi:hypothetical protein
MTGKREHGSNAGRSRKTLKYQIWLCTCVSSWKWEGRRDVEDMCNCVCVRVELVSSVYMYNAHVNALFGKPGVNVPGNRGEPYT